jgi:hypothetical protein
LKEHPEGQKKEENEKEGKTKEEIEKLRKGNREGIRDKETQRKKQKFRKRGRRSERNIEREEYHAAEVTVLLRKVRSRPLSLTIRERQCQYNDNQSPEYGSTTDNVQRSVSVMSQPLLHTFRESYKIFSGDQPC